MNEEGEEQSGVEKQTKKVEEEEREERVEEGRGRVERRGGLFFLIMISTMRQ